MQSKRQSYQEALLSTALKDQPPEVQARVWELAKQSHFDSDDPVLLFFIAFGHYLQCFEHKTKEEEEKREQFRKELDERLTIWGELQDSLLKQQAKVIAAHADDEMKTSVASLLNLAEVSAKKRIIEAEKARFWRYLLPALGLVVTAIASGGALGWWVTKQYYSDPQMNDANELYQLNEQQIDKCQAEGRRSCPVFLPESMMLIEDGE